MDPSVLATIRHGLNTRGAISGTSAMLLMEEVDRLTKRCIDLQGHLDRLNGVNPQPQAAPEAVPDVVSGPRGGFF